MNSMREGVLIVDDDMRIIASNSTAHETFQGVDGKLENLRLSDLTRNPSIHDAFRAAVDKGEHAEVKVEMRRGDRLIYDLRVAPLRFESAGRSRGAIGVFFDITQLERLERVRQEFLSNVSHELRTPLTAIIAFVETLEEGAIDDSENNRRFLTVIRRNAERMHNLIDDILELSSIEAGIVTVEPRQVRLAAVIDDIATALAARAETRGVTIQNEIERDVQVYAEARRLEQMLTNLIDNAIKFNREGGEVTVRHNASETRDCISVVDTGDGISSEHIERIFERFYRIDRARAREMGGTGLGLAIVKHLARAHGGEATVQSTPGEGSAFTIELPKQVIGNM
jgi:two-component system phosphate regulon sensor histidine kinase PhoR